MAVYRMCANPRPNLEFVEGRESRSVQLKTFWVLPMGEVPRAFWGETMDRKYAFSWALLGDLEVGRPNLGRHTRVEVYRLMQFCMRDELEREFGTEAADRIFFQSGLLAGTHFYDAFLHDVNSLDGFVARLQALLRDLEIGVLRVEEVNADASRVILTVSEDLDCSGLPELSYEICAYDEGFIAGLLGKFTGKTYKVKEVDCWCTGDRTCRFLAELVA